MRFLLLVLALIASRRPLPNGTDGDTIKLNGTTWRLWGIDAPETSQACGDWPPGSGDRRHAPALEGEDGVLRDKGRDRYGRSIGLCRADGQDLGAAMAGGMAWALSIAATMSSRSGLRSARGSGQWGATSHQHGSGERAR